MDLSEATKKLNDVSDRINEFKEKIDEVKEKYVKKINKVLEDLEHTINNAATKGAAWANPRIYKLNKKLQGYIDALNTKISNLVAKLEKWYEDTVNNIKIGIIKSILIKIYGEVDDMMVRSLTGLIPHPPLNSIISIPKIEVELPDINNLEASDIKLPRIEI